MDWAFTCIPFSDTSFDVLQERLECIVSITNILATACFPPELSEPLLKSLVRIYKILERLVRKVTNFVNKDLH